METVLVTAPTYTWKTLENGVGYIGNERGQFHFALTICGSVIYEFSADTEPEVAGNTGRFTEGFSEWSDCKYMISLCVYKALKMKSRTSIYLPEDI